MVLEWWGLFWHLREWGQGLGMGNYFRYSISLLLYATLQACSRRHIVHLFHAYFLCPTCQMFLKCHVLNAAHFAWHACYMLHMLSLVNFHKNLLHPPLFPFPIHTWYVPYKLRPPLVTHMCCAKKTASMLHTLHALCL